MATTTSKAVSTSQKGKTTTANGMTTYNSSLNKCVDMFFLAGASRQMDEKEIVQIFKEAFQEDRLLAMKILFWSRDIRGGAGERNFFNAIKHWLQENHQEILEKNLHLIPEYGYWKDVFDLDFDLVKDLIKKELDNNNALLAKWLPRQKGIASPLRPYLGMSPKEYRKKLVRLSNTVEQKMSEDEWDDIEYSHVPSKAFNKYSEAFMRHDPDGFKEFLHRVEEGEEKINAEAIFPQELYRKYKSHEGSRQQIDAQWSQLPDYLSGSDENILPVCDVSGSMNGLPMEVSVSLGVYLSERSQGIFKDTFMTFSETPQMQILEGSPTERMHQLKNSDWGYNTDLQAVFDTLLETAQEYNVSQNEMPSKILIISDMEFDQAMGVRRRRWGVSGSSKVQDTDTAMDMIQKQYKESGYDVPELIFWNVDGKIGNVPATSDVKNVGLVSGFSPSIMKSILSGEGFTPKDIMLRAVDNARYSPISA